MTDIKLRPYQQKFIDDVRNEFKQNHKRVVGVAPCGAGKTIMTGWMIKESARKGKRSIFFVHRHELIEQTANTFLNLDIPFGVIESGVKEQLNLPVQIASIQTLAKRLDKIPAPDFLICDECHHILANTYKKVINAFPDAFLLGVTATPLRMGGKTLSDIFSHMVKSPSVNDLIKLGNLTPFDYFAAPLDIKLNDVRILNGDFDTSQLAKKMADKKITGNIIDNYLKFAAGKSAICYCVNVNHSKDIAQAFNNAGITARHVDGETSKADRADSVDKFRRGNIKVLCNADLFGEGFDVPNCQAVILARPTESLTLFIQQSMRAMRPDPNDPNKRAVIIDCVQNRERHGLPNDFRDWSLNPNTNKILKCPNCQKHFIPTLFTKKKGTPFIYKFDEGRFFLKNYDKHGDPIKIRRFGICLFEDKKQGTLKKICPHCGFLISNDAPDTNSKHPIYKNGVLTKIDVAFDDEETNTENIICKPNTPEYFLQIAKMKNYKIGWVALQSLQFAKSYDDCLHIANICNYNKGWAFHKWQEISPNILQNAQLLC